MVLALQIILFAVLCFLPGFLWARLLFPSYSMFEKVILAPGLSFTFYVPLSFFLWGVLGLPIDGNSVFGMFMLLLMTGTALTLFRDRSRLGGVFSSILLPSFWTENIKTIYSKIRKEHLLVASVVGFGALLNFFPHFGYMLPFHTDEWNYIIWSKSLISTQDFSRYLRSFPETGYISILISIKLFTGCHWLDLALAFPTLVFAYAMSLFYILGRKHGPGYLSIFPILLVLTSVRYLGPALMVPIALFLVSLPLVIIILKDKNLRSLAFLPVLVISQLLVHPPTAIAILVVVMAGGVVTLLKDRRRGILIFVILAALFAPLTLPLDIWVSRLKWHLVPEQGYFFLAPPDLGGYLALFGSLLIFLSALGIVYILKERNYFGLISGVSIIGMSAVVMAFVFIFPTFNNVTALHDRAVFCLIVLSVIPAGFGLKALNSVHKHLSLFAIATLLVVSVGLHTNAQYYHLASDSEYDDFVWINENLNDTYGKAVLDPWKAIPFRAATGKGVYYFVPQGPDSKYETHSRNIDLFLSGGCMDTAFLTNNGLSIVYSPEGCTNPDLTMVHKNVYVLDL